MYYDSGCINPNLAYYSLWMACKLGFSHCKVLNTRALEEDTGEKSGVGINVMHVWDIHKVL